MKNILIKTFNKKGHFTLEMIENCLATLDEIKHNYRNCKKIEIYENDKLIYKTGD